MNFEYDLEINCTVQAIKKARAKKVCIQLPEGLKPLAGKIADELESKSGAEVIIWLGTCYGACDTPDLSSIKPDMLIAWGHSEWKP